MTRMLYILNLRKPNPSGKRGGSESVVHDQMPEGHKGQFHQFEVLVPERDADDGDPKQQAKKQMGKRNGQPADEEPDDVHQQREASRGTGAGNHFLPERPQRHFRQFERLQPEGNADDGNH